MNEGVYLTPDITVKLKVAEKNVIEGGNAAGSFDAVFFRVWSYYSATGKMRSVLPSFKWLGKVCIHIVSPSIDPRILPAVFHLQIMPCQNFHCNLQ